MDGKDYKSYDEYTDDELRNKYDFLKRTNQLIDEPLKLEIRKRKIEGFLENINNQTNSIEKEIFKVETVTKNFVLACSDSDLTKLDFKDLNLKILKIGSQDLISYCDSTKYDGWSNKTLNFLNELQDKNADKDLFVITQIDLEKTFNEKDFDTCYNSLLVLFPSEIQVISEIEFQVFDNKYLNWTYASEYSTQPLDYDQPFENFLYFDEDDLEKINIFLKLYIARFEKIKYLDITIGAYISSFKESNPLMSFLSLCISLESIISGTNELSYRIKRNIAILCSRTKAEAENIFYNVDLIYSLRSKILHGEEYTSQKIVDYLPYLRNLTSILILELILQNEPKIQDLNLKLTFAGFGDKTTLSEDYKDIGLNTVTDYNAIFKRLIKK